MKISKRQFSALAAEVNHIPEGETDTGFSVSVNQGPSGEVVHAADRYMVGGTPGQHTDTHDAPITGQHLENFANSNADLLSQPETFMGSWHEGQRQPKAQVDLDVSQGFPRTQSGSVSARHATVARNERALGEVDSEGGYAGTHDSPFSTRRLLDTDESGDRMVGVESHLNALRQHPDVYEKVVSGDVLGGIHTWVNRRPVRQS